VIARVASSPHFLQELALPFLLAIAITLGAILGGEKLLIYREKLRV